MSPRYHAALKELAAGAGTISAVAGKFRVSRGRLGAAWRGPEGEAVRQAWWGRVVPEYTQQLVAGLLAAEPPRMYRRR